jgi:hypothetical protein
VDTNTTNYYHQAGLSALDLHITEWPVLLSLEDKTRLKDVPPHWIVLQEPVADIHSMMFFSRAFLSTGDSMAREAAELGVPSFYLGTRDMPANNVLVDRGFLWQIALTDVAITLDELGAPLDLDVEIAFREEKRQVLALDWDDVNAIIRHHIEPYL